MSRNLVAVRLLLAAFLLVSGPVVAMAQLPASAVPTSPPVPSSPPPSAPWTPPPTSPPQPTREPTPRVEPTVYQQEVPTAASSPAFSPYNTYPPTVVAWQPVQVIPPPPPPAPVIVAPPQPVITYHTDKLEETTLYTRIDYFAWNERMFGFDFVNENGALWTLGYQHQSGRERYRGEFFTGSVHYSSDIYYSDGSFETLDSHTNYLGLRGEYEVLFNPEIWPTISFFVGIGTRFWIRDLPDDVTPSGTYILGYQETWWTIYPYIGVERRRVLPSGLELYGSSRIGITAMTFEHASLDDVRLYPRPGLTGTIEFGIRGDHLLLSLYCDSMSWGESAEVRGYLQPTSTMLTFGLRAGVSF